MTYTTTSEILVSILPLENTLNFVERCPAVCDPASSSVERAQTGCNDTLLRSNPQVV